MKNGGQLAIASATRDDGSVLIDIKDNGSGISIR